MRVVLSAISIVCVVGLMGCATSKDTGSSGTDSSGTSGTGTDSSGAADAGPGDSSGDASGTPPSDGSGASGTSASVGDDASFLRTVAQTNLAEIAVGKIAVERAGSDAVKKYGQRMIDDHTKANDELAKLAQSKGITLPTQPDAEHMALADKLSSLSGAAFDEEFMKSMHADHAKVVAMFEDKAKTASDAEVRAFAAKTLPTLQAHLQSASSLHDKHKNVGR